MLISIKQGVREFLGLIDIIYTSSLYKVFYHSFDFSILS
jgi:hypothetical protein